MNAEINVAVNDDEMIRCSEPQRQLERAIAIMHRLRAPGGCPWDAEQTHESLIANLIEECYECIDAIRSKDAVHLREELGDVLLQVLFHAELAQERPEEGFSVYDVARELCEKLVRRHPHVFGEAIAKDADEVLTRWDQIKRQERHTEHQPYLHDCGKGLPELIRAYKLTAKAAKVGFDWERHEQVVEKIREELDEVQGTMTLPDNDPRVTEELGDLLFTVVNLCRHRCVNPEDALRGANNKFVRRFHTMQQLLEDESITLQQADAEQFDQMWRAVKVREQASQESPDEG